MKLEFKTPSEATIRQGTSHVTYLWTGTEWEMSSVSDDWMRTYPAFAKSVVKLFTAKWAEEYGPNDTEFIDLNHDPDTCTRYGIDYDERIGK